ncbi:hypothetical protein Pmani_026427 [Petrolisthes manimaculis]|uniref:Secreted protein n=1 Tax=Petrolisthes manimaculis TaxID=1843537 RepID=A0AAE1U047_9EUCA|nr:hypothetical protein Pmani_026427 [Petrolisthes manimaculis]
MDGLPLLRAPRLALVAALGHGPALASWQPDNSATTGPLVSRWPVCPECPRATMDTGTTCRATPRPLHRPLLEI